MAEETKTQAKADEKTVAESTAFESSGPRAGKLKAGYQYRYESTRDKDGKLVTNRIVTKAGS